ncbi:MAG: hypothetical protein DWQ05_11740 [Calditrichaeota bacterium]|nr:MAG: hypothetical protein DWQ05_11740 [Calditrichota bacterium]
MKKNTIKIVLFLFAPVLLFAQEWNGFVEFGLSPKFTENKQILSPLGQPGNGQYYALGEQRLQLKFEHSSDKGELFFKVDFVNDNVLENSVLNIREAYFTTTPAEWMDVKIGRQIQTWGVGDLMFINDVFSKDWISFFSGRQDEYLKAPSDAVRLSLFPEIPLFEAIDISLMPYSHSDINLMTEGRFASVNPSMLQLIENRWLMPTQATSKEWKNVEVAARFQMQTIKGFTTSLYAYKGRWNNPTAMSFDPQAFTFSPYFSELQVYGASSRGAALGGILSLESGYYYSEEDKYGDNPLVPNSSLRYLALYERSLTTTLDLGVQYYGEQIQDFAMVEDNYKLLLAGNMQLMDGEALKDEMRHLVTLRLTKKMMNETLWLTWFSYFSPSDQDYFFRPRLSYEYSDQIRFVVTANILGAYGDNDDDKNLKDNIFPDYHNTMFGQFKDDSNINFTARYIF